MRIKHVVVVVATKDWNGMKSFRDLHEIFNNVQGCLTMGHDDNRFTIDKKMSIEIVSEKKWRETNA